MRSTDPVTAGLVPVLVVQEWHEGMPRDERNITIVGWNRDSDTAWVTAGRLTEVKQSERPLDQGDVEWLAAIGARVAREQ